MATRFLEKILAGTEAQLIKWIGANRYLPLQLDITNACNLRCKHCYHSNHNNSGALSFHDWTKIIDDYRRLIAKHNYRPFLFLCGGEPSASPLLYPILEYVRSNLPGCKVSILTNGTIASSLQVETLKSLPFCSFQVSLDGPNAETHDRVRGAGTFDRAIEGISFLKSHGFSVHSLAVLSKRNAEMIPHFFDLAKSLNLDAMNFTRLIAQGFGKSLIEQGQDSPLKPLELKRAYVSLIENSARTGVKTNTNEPLFNLLHPGLGRNGRYWEALVVSYKGEVLASSRSRLVIGNALEEGLEKIFIQHPLFQKQRAREIEVCGGCPRFLRCGGDRNAAYAETGNFFGVDPGCWLQEKKTQ